MPNFISAEPVHNFSNRWRNWLTVFLLVLVFIGAGWYVFRGGGKIDIVFELKALVPYIVAPEDFAKEQAVGGDVVFEHIPVITPVLSVSSTPFRAEELTAQSVIVKDNRTGLVLYQKNEYTPHALASITKLMSVLVLLEHDMDWATTTQVVVDDIVDTHMYAGDTYSLEELWKAGLVGSSNKAILTMIDATGWTRESFIARMNEKAQELGMGDTHFTDPTGIEATNISTASDIVLLLQEAMSVDKISKTLLLSEHTLYSAERNKSHHMWNTDWLLLGWIPNSFVGFRGGKTGYIPSAGYNFAMEVADETGNLIDVVVLGAGDNEARFTEARDLAEWVFGNYFWVEK